MIKKLMSLTTALAALEAFAVPAAASAAQAVTQPAGTLVPPGTTILGVSHNLAMQTELGEYTCPTVELSIETTENSGNTFSGMGAGTTSGPCEIIVEGETFPFTVSDITLSELMSTAGGVADIALSFEAHFSGELVCTFHTPSTATGDIVTYADGGSTLTLTNQPFEGGGCGPMEISADFAVTAGGSPVILDG